MKIQKNPYLKTLLIYFLNSPKNSTPITFGFLNIFFHFDSFIFSGNFIDLKILFKISANQMNTHFPITQAINADASFIIDSLNTRSQELRKTVASQSLFKRISLIAFKILGLAAGIVVLASLPVTAMTFAARPLTIGMISLGLAATCLALCMLLDIRSPGETIVKDHWKELFDALHKGQGAEIINTCKKLAKQKEHRQNSFIRCLGPLSTTEIMPFFHKTCFVGHLLVSLDFLRQNNDAKANENAYLALSHFESSNLSEEARRFAKEVINSPREIRHLLETHCPKLDLHSLDYLFFLRRQPFSPEK